ncbi:bifunctional ADP-dependent NAD(P)H-hydrate dehydratase/NAD(P)H-hydrate epimerase [Halobacteriales archaeon QS_4_62_28]|nr:MAG: bifunctional ADP-dependent NAD(P)H-hydrate dehydratase/NAD(P)H-hydrate epimerase [Halobacteriales archaeon QS_4_62_28]
MITGSEMGVVDENAAALGVSRKQLMESSGNAVARIVERTAHPDDQITVVAGRGNNGGDALVTARFLDGFDVRICLLGRPANITTAIARENWEALQQSGYETETVRDTTAFELHDPDVIVDAMLGTGITGAVREPEATAARAINESSGTVVSVDVPSGLDAETGRLAATAVETDHVVTFHDTKPGLDSLEATVTVADIGIPSTAELFVERGDLTRLQRDSTSHKGDNGETLVVGGGPYTGAPALTAQAALRTGTDLVRVACPAPVARELQGYSENLIVRPFDGDHLAQRHVEGVLELANEHDTVVLGPGLGDNEATLSAVQALLADYEGAAVVDADALQVVPEVDTEASLICTPHQGELEAMGGETSEDWRERTDLIEQFAARLDQTLVVKGVYDIVSNGDRTRVNRTGNAGMTVGGTGDVLAGVIGALAATQAPRHAGAIGTYATGRAGDIVVEQNGYGLVATDLLDVLPTALGTQA